MQDFPASLPCPFFSLCLWDLGFPPHPPLSVSPLQICQSCRDLCEQMISASARAGGALHVLSGTDPSPGWASLPIRFWCRAALPITPTPACLRVAGRAAAVALVLLVESRIQPQAGEKCKFGVRWCFPMVTELKPDKFPW